MVLYGMAWVYVGWGREAAGIVLITPDARRFIYFGYTCYFRILSVGADVTFNLDEGNWLIFFL